MIVVATIGLLAAMAIPNLVRARENTRNTRFASDLNVATAAFTQYAMENGNYPPDTTPGVMPDGMSDYLKRIAWTSPTTIGGQWDWDYQQFSSIAGVSVYMPTASSEQLKDIDAMIDDGDISKGTFRQRAQGYIRLIE